MDITQQISAVIITFNESKNIERALLSLKGVVDECIVVDNGSTDNTLEVAAAFGAKVIHQDWLGFGPQKNVGVDAASFDYILSIDADEALSESLRENIIRLKKKKMHSAYSMRILANYCGHWIRHCGWYPGIKTRLYDKREARWNDKLVHENLEFKTPCTPILLDGDLLHYSYTSLEDQKKKTEKYARLKAKDKHEQGKKSSLLRAYLSGFSGFFTAYILRGGFLDGKAGFWVSRYSGLTSFKAYKYLYELNRARRQ